MKLAPIRSQKAYEQALRRASQLITSEDLTELDELEIIQMLIEQWERERAPMTPPTALEAIQFRMAQEGLKPRDLEPYIGSRSRVSEVLSGARPLSIDMIRALHHHLGIPAASLIEPAAEGPDRPPAPSKSAQNKLRSLGIMRRSEEFPDFLARVSAGAPAAAMLRKTRTARTNAKTDQSALEAWCIGVILRADAIALAPPTMELNHQTARIIASLSAQPSGPLEANQLLARMGVALVILDHLPGTYLDGAALRRTDGAPVIALTLRHNRIDNFWFTLLHECAHVCLHLDGGRSVIVDDLDVKGSDGIESEADSFASEALIPSEFWADANRPNLTASGVIELANRANIHPAIVAGRWQREFGDYRRFSRMLGHGEVRRLFETPI